jgi:hypothetical protein
MNFSIIAASRLRPNSFLIDIFADALVGYSLRKLKESTINVIRVRRSSDNAELNFRANEITDGTLTTWTGAGDAFVTIIYDQVGSNDMTQTNASRQGMIVIGGTLQTDNGKPVILRSTDNNGGYISAYAPNNGVTVKGVFYVGDNEGRSGSIFGSNSGGSDYGFLVTNGSSSTFVDNFPTISLTKLNGTTTTIDNRGQAYTASTNQFSLYREIDFRFENNVLALGYRHVLPSNFGMLSFQEMVIFGNTNDTVEKENNVNAFYSIY